MHIFEKKTNSQKVYEKMFNTTDIREKLNKAQSIVPAKMNIRKS